MRTKKGTITSTKMESTLVVTVHSYDTHPIYKKRYRKSSKFYVHAPSHNFKEGDEVTIQESKPISKTKRWILASTTEQTTKNN
jgi:small subunit ribosomal protein S17